MDSDKCVHYAQFASHLTPATFDVVYWILFLFVVMMLFKGGQMASMKVGAMPKQKILEWLNEAGVADAA